MLHKFIFLILLGGPLINIAGEVVGVMQSGASIMGIFSNYIVPGFSFAITIDDAKNFLKLADEKVKNDEKAAQGRRYLGMTVMTLTPEVHIELKLRELEIPDHGNLVWRVFNGSPAHISGLIAGDIILKINNIQLFHSSDIAAILSANTKVLHMEVLRDGKKIEISVVSDDPK